MSIEGLASIDQRIAGIQATIDTLSVGTISTQTTSDATTFEQALSLAVQESTGAWDAAQTSDLLATTATTGELNASGVPVELADYGNGQIPAAALAEVGDTGHRLWAPASESLERLLAHAERDGITIGINDSYRTYDKQVELVGRLGLYDQGGLAAVPGTSRHGWGMAVDLRLDDAAQAWMRANAEQYGFKEDTPREPWHWGFYL